MKTSEKIKKYLKEKQQSSVNELVDYLQISRMAVSKQLSNLLAQGEVVKIGKSPVVFYMLKEEIIKKKGLVVVDNQTLKIIEENFLFISPTGERKQGMNGFEYWCERTNQPIEKTATEYVKTLKKYNAFKKNGIIDGIEKFNATFEKVGLDKIFYLDFYSIERFGKTKLGQLLLYAKQSQNKKLMRELTVDIKPKIDTIIQKYNIDGIGFIPPTVKREVQLMKELEKNLHEHVRRVSIVKIKTEIIVPQKTLTKLSDRIENAKNTIIVDERAAFKNILLIDDAVGSGATLNETALQIKQKGIAKKVIGLSITGSFKGFDVISEV
ncbi:MAG: hypothetical protein US57_C0003G0056 [Candidatus Moranbacteria bacterium GW2011_GWC2_37_73]|nr:MAG: hypothetical protein UR95_C0003G0003 [Parcubacteria group bacterium GW2011_GWC1_36_108]KKP99306.1 MAG: hypothetical protein US09_C0030G0007 [Candidatus Moranbacteria bacterium GW2011_GWD1_36_198]KKQ00753.1 MAG: hypothetical protein US10_C0026G0008 [Candidatus Moranbacteria bacterium GW2011_GWD2_36_198]KKQ40248.1 MAG: hypothetical protein US57_C0003G0056 [Candidatus Moranbacteria bacterium GW2011_GWC2_37_73]HAR99588.1 hypothetical protein [Candidatus Moranbacteria bacterium]